MSKSIHFLIFPVLATLAISLLPRSATAADLFIAASMQRCTQTEECMLVPSNCQDNCAFVPVNKTHLSTMEQAFLARCARPLANETPCDVTPAMSSACINGRCTIDYAYAHHASAPDYKSGAFSTPPAAVPSEVQGDYSHVKEKQGFTAYDLPESDIRKDTLGQIHTKVYVPPSAPVSGEQYVPVTPPVQPATQPQPTAQPAPPVAPAVVAPAQQEPAPIPEAAAPSVNTVPSMTPSQPNQVPPGPSDENETMTDVNQGVPRAPDGTPVPPSDLQPTPTYVPPAGTAIPVGPNDPGAPPAEGTIIMLKDTDAVTPPTEGSKKSFSSKDGTKYEGSAKYN